MAYPYTVETCFPQSVFDERFYGVLQRICCRIFSTTLTQIRVISCEFFLLLIICQVTLHGKRKNARCTYLETPFKPAVGLHNLKYRLKNPLSLDQNTICTKERIWIEIVNTICCFFVARA